MGKKSPLANKLILAVDDEEDILETLEEILDMCELHKAKDFETAKNLLLNNSYDIVILDIMGVNGFELLKVAVKKNFPTVMLTARAITPEALKNSINLGAVFFLAKEQMPELNNFLEEVVLNNGKPIWIRLFDQFGEFFNRRFSTDWKKKDKFFQEFEKSLRKSE
jgi:DNA-binding response OmpR family regulator